MALNGATNGLAVTDILKLDADKGRVVVHSFDSAASPAEKGAIAGQARDQLQSVTDNSPQAAGREVQVHAPENDIKAIPTITVQHHDEVSKPARTTPNAQTLPHDDAVDTPPVLGGLPPDLASAIPSWYKVGWRQMSGIDNEPLRNGEEKDKGVLDLFLSEQLYGDWYHNAAIIFFAVFTVHFLTRFGFGWGWLFIVLAVCSTYYTTSMQRVRRHARDDIQRELVKTRLASEHESADWINNFLDRFWLIYEPVLSATIISSVDQVLSTNTPPFLDSLRLSQFTLGTKAPRIDRVRTFPKTPDDIIIMDWGISFTPTDLSDLTPKQAAAKVNPKIVLSVRVGKSIATATMPILVEDICFSGLMRVRMKLMSNFPHIEVVDLSFLEKPVIDYVLKPIGGETFGFDIGNIPGLSAFIREMTHGTLGPMMYDPNVFTLNLRQMLSGKPLDAAIGVLRVTVQAARGIKGTKIGGGTPDPYVSLSINHRAELARTKTKTNTYNPTWMESKFILLNALNESLVLSLWDFNDHRKDTQLGSATFELSKLVEDATQEDVTSQLLLDGKERGELRYDLAWYPVLEPEEGKELGETSVGIVRLTIHQAKDLDASKSMAGDLNPLAKVFVGDTKTAGYTTPCFKHTNNPIWESSYEFICQDKKSSLITMKVIDDREFMNDPVIGYMSITLTDLLQCMEESGRDWFPLSGCKTGKVRLSAEWKPLNMAGSLEGADQYQPPIGVVRLLLDKATDVKNVEAALGGKSDPYVRVQVNNVTKTRTEVINNSLSPVWDQIVYVPVHSLKEILMLECMDYQHLTSDRSLGLVELHVSALAKASDNAEYHYESTGVKEAVDPIRLDKGNSFKGHLHYTATFIPSLAVKGVKFDSKKNELATGGKANDTGDNESTISSSSDEDIHPVPSGATIKLASKEDAKGHVANKSSNSSTSSLKSDTAHTPEPSASKEGVELSTDELLAHQSGIVIFNVKSGSLTKKARLEVLLDDGYWPCLSTTKARSHNAVWEYVGEGFIREVDFSRVWLRLNEADEGNKDDVISEWKGSAKQFLQSTLSGPQEFVLRYDEYDERLSTVVIESRYVPVPVQLEPRETVNNQGIIRVDLIGGNHIQGVDRGGKSDPFAVFTLNGVKVYKSETRKKTLSPEWNEQFNIEVPSRFRADFSVEIFDWNQFEVAKSLGSAKIDVASIEPFEVAEQTLHLASAKHGEKGEIVIRMMFTPEIIAKSRKSTSTFSSAGRAMTQLGGLPVSAGMGVLHGVTGVLHGVPGVFKRSDQDHREHSPDAPSHPVALPDTLEARTLAVPKIPADGSPQEPGTLQVTVVNARDLSSGDSKPYATIRVGDKEFKTRHTGKTGNPEWSETFEFPAGALTPKLFAWIYDHKTIGRDKELGEGEIDIWRHLQQKGQKGVSTADVTLELRPAGQIRLRLQFDPTPIPLTRSVTASSSDRMSRIGTIPSPSRFSLSRNRRPLPDHDS